MRHDREENPSAIDITQVIELGELRPKGECEVIAWTDRSLSNYDYASVQVTHESGVGKIRGAWRMDRFSYIVGDVLKVAGVVVFSLACIYAVTLVPIWLLTRHEQQATPTPSPSPSSLRQATSPSPPPVTTQSPNE